MQIKESLLLRMRIWAKIHETGDIEFDYNQDNYEFRVHFHYDEDMTLFLLGHLGQLFTTVE